MGGYYSVQSKSDEEDDVMFKEEPEEFTPSKPLRDLRLLALDPRSPSKLIDRTPIIVDRTPDVLGYKTKLSHTETDTPCIGPVINDPRSPTTEFTRTPINPCCSSSASTRQRITSLPTTTHNTDESDFDEPQSYLESADVSPVLLSDFSGQPAALLESPESAISSDKEIVLEKNTSLHDTTESDPEGLNTTPLDVDVPAGFMEDEIFEDMDTSSEMFENKSTLKVTSVDDSTPKLPVAVQSISHHKMISMKPKMLPLASRGTWSPLSAIENSPRLLLQRNNLQSRGNKPTPARNVLLDKENINIQPTTSAAGRLARK